MNIEIADRLVKLRKGNGLSQEALAEKLGISRQAVSKWERAEASPDTDNLIMLARLYKVSLDELLRTEDEIPLPDPAGYREEALREPVKAVGTKESIKCTEYEAVHHDSGTGDMRCEGEQEDIGNWRNVQGGGSDGRSVHMEEQGNTEKCDVAEEQGVMGNSNTVEKQEIAENSGSAEGQKITGGCEKVQRRDCTEGREFAEGGQEAGRRPGFDEQKKDDWRKEKKKGDTIGSRETDEEKQEYVHLGFEGIHVLDKDGSEVHVGWDGIHVDDRKKGDDVHIDGKGVYVNGKKYDRKRYERYYKLPMPALVVILYFFMGAFFQLWHPTWMLFLLIPLWYSFLGAVKNRNPHIFAYPVLATLLFLAAGFFFGAWHPAWVIFLTVPAYYPVVSYFSGREDED